MLLKQILRHVTAKLTMLQKTVPVLNAPLSVKPVMAMSLVLVKVKFVRTQLVHVIPVLKKRLEPAQKALL